MNVSLLVVLVLLGGFLLLGANWKKLRQRLYMRKLPRALHQQWIQLPLRQNGIIKEVACRECPKFARFPARCTVPFGSPLRKCITASVEYHLRNVAGLRVLEVGCGESSHAKQVVEAGGGEWIGLDPRAGKHGLSSVRSVGGIVQQMPFLDASFDVVCGVQTLEHWEQVTARFSGLGYQSVLDEVWRVLKPGGWIYLDAPIHLHGAPEFIRGDIPAIQRIFQHRDWRNLRLMSWRRLHEPLRRRPPPAADREGWPASLPGSVEAERAQLATQSTWVIAIRADKPAA